MDGNGYGDQNEEGARALDFALENNLAICNTFFQKRDSHLITYHSGVTKTQIDFIMVRKDLFKSIKAVKVIPSEECVPQHKLLVCEFKLRLPKISKKIFQSKTRCWKLKDQVAQLEFRQIFAKKIKKTQTPLRRYANEINTSFFDC